MSCSVDARSAHKRVSWVNSRDGVLVQEESNGTQDLRYLSELGITAIDYANNRCEFDGVLRITGVASGQIKHMAAQKSIAYRRSYSA